MAQRRGGAARGAAAAPRAGPLCRPDIRANADAACAKPGRCLARALALRLPDARVATRRQSVPRRRRPVADRSPDPLERERRGVRLERARGDRLRSDRDRSRSHSDRLGRSHRAGPRRGSGERHPHVDASRGRRRARHTGLRATIGQRRRRSPFAPPPRHWPRPFWPCLRDQPLRLGRRSAAHTRRASPNCRTGSPSGARRC